MRGDGFRFEAPPAWRPYRTGSITGARPAGEASAIVYVEVFRLRRPYDPGSFGRTVKVLDGVVAGLTHEGWTLDDSATVTVDGGRARAYRLSRAKPHAYDARIGFVLSGSREYELYCQQAAGVGDISGACRLLFDSFTTLG